MTDPSLPQPDPDVPLRHGSPWTADQQEKMIRLVKEGRSESEIAHVMGRTGGSIGSQAKKLLPPEKFASIQRAEAVGELHRYLRDVPDYDWQKNRAGSARKRRESRGRNTSRALQKDPSAEIEELAAKILYAKSQGRLSTRNLHPEFNIDKSLEVALNLLLHARRELENISLRETSSDGGGG
jgi:hypothetical protein